MLEVGKLYSLNKYKWLLPFDSEKWWSKAGPIMYLGEDILLREDGKRIVNHLMFAKGQRRLVDASFLRLLTPLEEEVKNESD